MGRARRIEPIPIPTENSFSVALSARGNTLVYTRENELVNIWAAELNSEGRPEHVRQQITSTWGEENPQFSPDGRRVVYQSARSGRSEIWVCDRDGSRPHQLTDLGATVSGFPRWSPDGMKIAFHSRPQVLASLYVIDAAGGKPRQLTSEVGDNTTPSWSHDGRWIYFGSRRTGQSHIWRMSATGGPATQMTDRSGWCPLESKDGRVLYYTAMDNGALRAVPLAGGPEREVLTGLAGYGSAYAPAAHGVYVIRTVAHGQGQELAFFDEATRRITTLAGIPKRVSLGLALSPEEDLLLFTQVDRWSSDLMMVKDFR
jgi:Tol biopolymer transport system component